MDINLFIAEELNLKVENVNAAISLLDEGATVPFIARYRKDVTGGLTDENLRNIETRLIYIRNLEDRKKTVFASLAEQNITDEKLLNDIKEAKTLAQVEDLYRPYKPKKATRASKAKEAGLEPLSKFIISDKTGLLEEEANKYLCEKYPTTKDTIQGALDILAENISDKSTYRTFIKDLAFKNGLLESEKLKDATSDVFDNYANYSRKITAMKGYNILAINRGVNKKVLTKRFVFDDEAIITHISNLEIPSSSPYKEMLKEMIIDSYSRLIKPSVENDIFSSLMDKASDEAINEFKISLKATLMAPPLRNKRILGFDPGFVNGCKIACIDENGTVLDTFVLTNPFANDHTRSNAKYNLFKLITKNKIDAIALGNGTAGRDSEKLLNELKKENPSLNNLDVFIVSESGASIWSATENAQKEFPDLSPNLRSAISIARRLLDPLAELVKIPPESIGVGQYQYDIDSKKLSQALNATVEDCVNAVGVDINTASAALLSKISGISSKLATSIVSYREENGAITSIFELNKIKGFGPKAFENAAGFIRVPESKEFLDNTAVHPESYPIAKAILSRFASLNDEEKINKLKSLTQDEVKQLSSELNVGILTLNDIIKELIKPSRDPRDTSIKAKLNENITDIKDIKEGQILEGTIRNVTAFGFFVDIGVEINGLVHISEISSSYISDPHSAGSPGDIIKVKVIGVDLKRNRISLSMKNIK